MTDPTQTTGRAPAATQPCRNCGGAGGLRVDEPECNGGRCAEPCDQCEGAGYVFRPLEARARELHGLTVPSASAMWPLIATMQRAGLIRLHWLTGKRAKLRFVEPSGAEA